MWTQPRAGTAARQRRTPQRGLALVTVLWVLMLLALPGSGAAAVDEHLAARAEGFTARPRQHVYTVHTEAYLDSGAVFVREAVVRLGGGAQGFPVRVGGVAA